MFKVLMLNKIFYAEKNELVLDLIKKNFCDSYRQYLVCKINSTLCDLNTIIDRDCEIELLTIKSSEAQYVFKHSSAHILGSALLKVFRNGKLAAGPPTENGFYYDIYLENHTISQKDFKKIEKEINKIIRSDFIFKRRFISFSELEKFYKENPFKTYFINKSEKTDKNSIYSIDKFDDYCNGPHLPSTSYVGIIELLKCGSSYFLGKKENQSLQRISAISFETKEELTIYKKNLEMALKNDHRRVGAEMELFTFHPWSPGSAFFLPKGTYVYNKLIEMIKSEYVERGYQEVITPNVFNIELWKTSGHYKNYSENLFIINNKEEEIALKPMNCPAHCLIFDKLVNSYRDLPLRLADFGVLHRNELSGTLSGLSRVRRFVQDDAHIFCELKSIESEIENILEFIYKIMKIFNFKLDFYLSTRPEKYMGKLEDWEKAENILKKVLNSQVGEYTLNEGDGAFYGPKIDILLTDCLNRKFQCSTIQLDFQLPKNFKLRFTNADSQFSEPVIIHRAVLGSIERFMSIVIENYGWNLPFFITPNQIALIPITCSEKYLFHIKKQFKNYQIKLFNYDSTLNKKIRTAINESYKLILLMGEKEENDNTITVYKGGTYTIQEMSEKIEEAVKNKTEVIFN